MKTYSVYIIASASGVLYIGLTNDLERRVFEHQKKLVPGFSARYNVCKLVYFELFGNVHAAIAREKELKGWLRKRKIALIESVNPKWSDLSAQCHSPLVRHSGSALGCHSERSEESLPMPLHSVQPIACHSERSEESLPKTPNPPKPKRDSSSHKPGLRMTHGA